MNAQDKNRADRVIKVFKDSKLTQKQFSDLIGVSQQLISAVVNYTKKPNESILFGIIDNIESVDPLWLITGKKLEKVLLNNVTPISSEKSPIEYYLEDIVDERIDRLAEKILKHKLTEKILSKLSNIEELVGENKKSPKQ